MSFFSSTTMNYGGDIEDGSFPERDVFGVDTDNKIIMFMPFLVFILLLALHEQIAQFFLLKMPTWMTMIVVLFALFILGYARFRMAKYRRIRAATDEGRMENKGLQMNVALAQ